MPTRDSDAGIGLVDAFPALKRLGRARAPRRVPIVRQLTDDIGKGDLDTALANAPALLDVIAADLSASRLQPAMPAWQDPSGIAEDEPQRFLEGVQRILQYLAAGDIFQVNLSRAWRAHFEQPLDPAALYARLRTANPAPFAGLFVAGDWAVASSSPERLVSVRGDVVETRPIAGTRPRF